MDVLGRRSNTWGAQLAAFSVLSLLGWPFLAHWAEETQEEGEGGGFFGEDLSKHDGGPVLPDPR